MTLHLKPSVSQFPHLFLTATSCYVPRLNWNSLSFFHSPDAGGVGICTALPFSLFEADGYSYLSVTRHRELIGRSAAQTPRPPFGPLVTHKQECFRICRETSNYLHSTYISTLAALDPRFFRSLMLKSVLLETP